MGRSGLKAIIHITNIKSRFKTTNVWLLNPKAMHNNTRPSEIYIMEQTQVMQGVKKITKRVHSFKL
jgi:hypothetical protein